MATLRLQKYGWRPDKPDIRDLRYSLPQHLTSATALPSLVDLRPGCPDPYDQQDLGSCTGNAIAGDVHFDLIKQNPATAFQPSPLFIYYNERVLENSVNEDTGAEIRDGIKSLVRWGVCPEQYWPYVVSKFKTKPSAQAFKNAQAHRIDKYFRVNQDPAYLKACLAEGFPFVFGFTVYSSFESQDVANTGVMPMPGRFERSVGGHAVLCVGYDDSKSCYIVRNSWGASWGMKGYFTMPYDYMHNSNLCDDFWTIRFVN